MPRWVAWGCVALFGLAGGGCARSAVSGGGAAGAGDGGALDAGVAIRPALASVPYFGVPGRAPADTPQCDVVGGTPAQQRCDATLESDAIVLGEVTHLALVSGPTVWDVATSRAEPAADCQGTIRPVLEVVLAVRDRLRGESPDPVTVEVPFGPTWIPAPAASDGGLAWTPAPPYTNGAGPVVAGQALGAYLFRDAADGLFAAAIFDLEPRPGTGEANCCFQPIFCWSDLYQGRCRRCADVSQEIVDCETGRIQPAWPSAPLSTDRLRASALPRCMP